MLLLTELNAGQWPDCDGERVRTRSGSDGINTQLEWQVPSLPLRVLTRPPWRSGYCPACYGSRFLKPVNNSTSGLFSR